MNGAVLLRMSKRSIRRFRSSGLWHLFGSMLPGVLKALLSIDTFGTTQPATELLILEDLNPHNSKATGACKRSLEFLGQLNNSQLHKIGL